MVNFLDSIKHKASAVYLLGDMFDFWYEFRLVVPKGYTRFLGKLSELTDMGVEVHRWMNVTHQFFQRNAFKNLQVKVKDLCTYEMGPTSTANIWYARECAERGFDGLIHIKSANCTPEIDIMPVLQRISGEYKIPTLYLTYDSQTSDVGLMTRLEAFYDMIQRKRRTVS